MSSLFKTGGNSANPVPPIAGLRIQSSQQGKPRPIVWGTTRIAGDIIDYIDFFPVASSSSGSSGGKGGSGSSGPTTYNYFVSFDVGLCEGPIAGVLRYWNGKGVVAAATVAPPGVSASSLVAWGKGTSAFTIFTGTYAQSAWGYMASAHPERALNYRGLAHAASAGFPLGTSTEIPNFSWEVQSAFTGYGANGLDANPRDVVVDALTNVNYSVGFPVARLDTSMTQFSNYAIASGLVISPALVEQRELSAFLIDIFLACNSSPRWSSGKLSVVPWGDAPITANGVTYTPNVTPVYDITYDDLLPNQGSAGSGSGTSGAPIIFVRKRKSDALNDIKIEFLDRTNNYDPNATAEGKDESSIIAFGNRSSLRQLHLFCDANAAYMSAALQIAREQIPGDYTFTLGPSFILVDVEDLLTLTSLAMGMLRQGVRVTDIQENADGSLTFQAEEFLGTAAAPLYGRQASLGTGNNYNADPGVINAPILFEPPALLGGGLDVWAAISGAKPALWGGCNVYASYDGITFAYVGIINGPARMGALSGAIASVTPAATGQTVDQTNTLHVDLTESAGTLASGSTLDATSLNTACYVDGEIIAYKTATLTATSKYDLTYLVRGAYLSTIGAHANGSQFARLDQGIFKLPYSADRIGATVYLKFCSFNIWGGGLQSLAAVSPYTFTLTGSALKYPLSAVANLRSVLVDFVNNLWWDEVVDPIGRPIQYEVRKGPSWAGGLVVQRQAHPPFTTHGNDTYWVSPVSTPVSGLTVYGPATSIVVSIASLTFGAPVAENDYQAIGVFDEQATGWTGTFYGGAGVDTTTPGNTLIRTGGAGNILADPDFLHTPNIFDYGGEGSGGYIEPSAHWVNGGRLAGYLLQCDYSGQGVPVGQNILSIADFLNDPDVLGAATTSLIDVHMEIAISQDGSSYGSFQKYSPGLYYGMAFKRRMVLNTMDSTVIAYGTKMKTYVFAPARTDHYVNLAITPSGLNLVFTPDGSATPAPFNGGPNNASSPIFFGQINAAAAGDILTITNLTKSGCTVQVLNGGVGQTRTVQQLNVEGY